jgi:hypothetical protein
MADPDPPSSNPSPLDNADYARFAWARYWRLMRWMAGLTIVAVVIALSILYWKNGEYASIHMFIATAVGISASILLMAALMGLVFLSSGSGHDEAIDDRIEQERPKNGEG